MFQIRFIIRFTLTSNSLLIRFKFTLNSFHIRFKCVSDLLQIRLEIRFKFKKQLFAGVWQSRCSQIFCKIEIKPLVAESLFSKVTGLQPAALFKKRLLYRCFPVNVNFAKILKFTSNFRSKCSQVFCKISVLKNFIKPREKHLWQSLFLIKLHVSKLQLYLKRDSGVIVFLKSSCLQVFCNIGVPSVPMLFYIG